jgi:hypothetical protein
MRISPFAFISPKGRLNSHHNGMSAQELSFELSSEAGPPGAIIHILLSLWLFIITSDSGIRRRISWLVFLFIGRRAVTHSLSYPDRPQRLAIAFSPLVFSYLALMFLFATLLWFLSLFTKPL